MMEPEAPRGYVCVITENSENIVIDSREVEKMTAAEIREHFLKDFSAIGIRTPFYSEAIPADCNVLSKYREIVLADRPKPYECPKFCLFDFKQKNGGSVFIRVNVEDISRVPIPPIDVPIAAESIASLTFYDFFSECSRSLSIESNPQSITFQGKMIVLASPLSDFFTQMRNSRASFCIRLSEQSQKTLEKRTHLINELMATEQNMLSSLQSVFKFWLPRLQQSTIFTPSELEFIFADIKPIISSESEFLSALEGLYCGYSTCVAKVFLFFADSFKNSSKFISKYQEIATLFHSKSCLSGYKMTMPSLSTKQHGADLMSILGAPIQRVAKYIVVLRELINCTPVSHPDFSALPFALNKIEGVQDSIDSDKETLLIQKITGVSGRKCMGRASVVVNGKDRGSICIVDKCVLLIKGDGYEEFSLDSVEVFGSVGTCAQLKAGEKTFSLEFTSKERADEIRSKIKFSSSVPFQNASVSAKLESLETYLGRRMERVSEFDSIFSLRKSFAASIVGTVLYITGGETDSGLCNDILQYDIVTHTWLPPLKLEYKRLGHSCVAYNGTLVAFGGKSDKLLNDVIIIDTNGTTINVVACHLPEPRMFHSACVKSDSMFIIGGQGEETVLGDLWEFELKSRQWSRRILHGLEVVPRKMHFSFYDGKEIITVGGFNKNGNAEPISISLETNEVSRVEGPTTTSVIPSFMRDDIKAITIYGRKDEGISECYSATFERQDSFEVKAAHKEESTNESSKTNEEEEMKIEVQNKNANEMRCEREEKVRRQKKAVAGPSVVPIGEFDIVSRSGFAHHVQGERGVEKTSSELLIKLMSKRGTAEVTPSLKAPHVAKRKRRLP